MDIMGWFLVACVVLAAAVGGLVVLDNHRNSSPELKDAREKRAQYRGALRTQKKAESAARSTLEQLSSTTGRRIKSVGGVTLYERWIHTPQGSGSIIGVKATAADESSVTQRLTVTRMVAFGVFSLAAPKKKGHGNSYVVIDGPKVSGVAVIAVTTDNSAGPKAFAFAADINNAARLAEQQEPTRPKRIEAAREQLAKAKNGATVSRARTAYDQAVAALPPEHRGKFSNALDAN